MTVVLIGPPAAGKSRAGRRLARRLEASYLDTDRVIAAAHGPVPDIFRTLGEPAFREIERETVARSLDEAEVVSLGGGAVMDPQTQAALAGHTILQVVASPAAIERRIVGNTKRPLLQSIDDWIALYEQRRETYDRLAVATFDTSFRPMRHVVDDMEAWLAEHAPREPGQEG